MHIKMKREDGTEDRVSVYEETLEYNTIKML